MPWGEVTRVSLREEFVQLAMRPCANRRELCRRFKISPKTGYKWLQRYKLAGLEALKDPSRRPHRSPRRTDQTTEQEVISLRAESLDCWGGRKLSRQLLDRGGPELAPSTITKILHRHGGHQMRRLDQGRAVRERIDHRQPHHLSFGARGQGAG